MPFVDEAKIFVKAGSGGKGCSSLYRHRRLRHPKPNGGCGGKGGDVVFVADGRLRTLLDFRYNRHFKAHSGLHGGSNDKQGRDGEDCTIRVPVGTMIKELPAATIIRDFKFDGDSVIVARGGNGGMGNGCAKVATDGRPGEERELFLELRLIADVGIIGFPNAGKSTLISKISNATPRIASYPFTTRDPVLGILETSDYAISIADLPGIIEGAHEGKGLGFRFLKHALRTRFFIHVVDIVATDGRNPVDDFDALNNELKFYNPELARKPQLIVANKIDCEEATKNLERFKKHVNKRVYAISALTGEGLEELTKAIIKQYEKTLSCSA